MRERRVLAEAGGSDGIVRAFVEARHEARGLALYPGPLPADLDQAYAIQDAAILLDGRPIGGWKLGRINPPLDAQFGANRLAGPIFADTILDSPDAVMPIIADGFGAAEAEFLLRLGQAPDPSRSAWTNEEARSLVDAVHIGVEIASSPFPGINDHGPAVTASDFGNNFGMLVGPGLTDWRSRNLDDISVSTRINGKTVGQASTATMLDGPWGALRFLIQLMQRRGIVLRQGQWVSTGAVTGVHPVRPGDKVEAWFDDQVITCRITAATPREERERKDVGNASGHR
jgi:2-keto-4-pentenoate hydratase